MGASFWQCGHHVAKNSRTTVLPLNWLRLYVVPLVSGKAKLGAGCPSTTGVKSAGDLPKLAEPWPPTCTPLPLGGVVAAVVASAAGGLATAAFELLDLA